MDPVENYGIQRNILPGKTRNERRSKVIELHITMTGKSYNPKDQYCIFGDERHSFPTMQAARDWLKERYGSSKRVPMYHDTKDGRTKQTGYVYGFRNADWSHAPLDKWLQQDWVSFRESEPLVIGKGP